MTEKLTQGQCMRRARERAGLKRCKLARLSGVASNTISNIEHDKRHGGIDTITILADALGISIDDYVGHKVKKHGKI